jgi:hypothetical protein
MSAALVIALVVIVIVILALGRGGGSSDQATTVPSPLISRSSWSEISSQPTQTSSEQTAPTPDPEQAALGELERLRSQDLQSVSLQGQWAAQIASKVPEIVDPKQTTQSGSHLFTAADILAEHLSLRNGDNLGATVILLKSIDYGKRQTYAGQPLWVTFAEGSFSGSADVLSWCSRRFPDLSGDILTNACVPRQLKPIA